MAKPGYWTNKVVLITGASSGIGKGIALEIASRGAHLGLLARREDLLNEIVSEANARNVKAIAVAADVRDVKAVREAADHIRKELGPIDILIANAGIGTSDHATRLTPEHAEKVIGINVLGAINSVAAVLPEMVERGYGRLVAISSLAAYRGLAKSAAYCASKAGLTAYFESLRIDLRHTGVGVSIIHPGFIKTALTSGREAKMPYLMELDAGVNKIVSAIEKEKALYAFPWQLATIVRASMLMPPAIYDWIAERNSFRE
ncbi:MAG TPA: SDR family NAD(P)-dependent oxidoreductase [Pyrinomonadaceae bacterium]|nr:SDR family NAD(P)-dependent oxidoreductase [Pyrinomonadaceae bacterium]